VANERLGELTAVVRDLITNTRFLHATGLNLLTYSKDAKFDPYEVERAFAWLLPITREKLLALKAPGGARLEGLQLSNFRLPGRRNWQLNGDRVHLLYGANGTGKSSIAEALELAVTGSVERIQVNAANDYAKIIRNSQSSGEATISLSLSDGKQPSFTVVPEGLSGAPLERDLPATAFRLDQAVMDQLVRASSQQRAKVLTRAFFPGPAYDALEAAHGKFLQAFRDLPAEIQTEIQNLHKESDEWPNALIPRLDWVEGADIPVERLPDFLPLSRKSLEDLSGIVPEIADCLTQLDKPMERDRFEATLKILDNAVGRVRTNVRRHRDAVVGALSALDRVAGWTPDPTPARMEYRRLLEEWTERVALRDILRKHLDITRTIVMARRGGWSPAVDASQGLLSVSGDQLEQSIASLVEAAEQCDQEHNQLLAQLQGQAGEAQPEHAITSLTTNEISDLNLAGEWWGKHQSTPPGSRLGTTIQKAISENKPVAFGTVTVGSGKWADDLRPFLTKLSPALEELLAFDDATPLPNDTSPRPIYRSPVVRLSGFKAALEAARKDVDAALQVEQTLMKRLEEEKLNKALDEVVALFTPARWAYEGLLVEAKRRDGKVAVELVTTTGSQADMRLNTAELNVVVLALYLLCGPTMSNPLSTIILDDPLQNMDELTAATVARGVAKVAALLPEGWQLMMMFHGEEHVETFRREVPGSVYCLPWLGPVNAAGPDGGAIVPDVRKKPAGAPAKLSSVIEVRTG
jgi:AAA domain